MTSTADDDTAPVERLKMDHSGDEQPLRWPMIFEQVERLAACEQCGECSSACPLTGDHAGSGAFNVRRILRHVELGLIDAVAATDQPWRCLTCGRCEAACPNGIPLLDIIRRLRRIAPADVVAAADPPCVAACPAGIDIPGYLRFVARGEPQRALRLIAHQVPLAGVLGRVCPHPCEAACQRGRINQPVEICQLKRYAADRGGEVVAEPGPDTGRRVAVIGSGPAGLTAAYLLRLRGHRVTVIEARAEPGGMMRYGIPRYRLPRDVLDREIGQILATGIELRTGVRFGADLTVQQLRGEEGFDAVFIATGLQRSCRIEIEGTDLEPVDWGVEFLAEVASGRAPDLQGQRTVVIGGGDVATDVALTARRIGAAEVTMICLERPEQMPAHASEIALVLEEGVSLLTGWGPEALLGDGHRLQAVKLRRCLEVFDEQGRFAPTFADERRTVDADRVIFAVGQTADLGFIDGASSLARESSGALLRTDDRTGETGTEGLFAGGEIASGPGALVDAIANGRRVAAAIDRYLGGDGAVAGPAAQRPASNNADLAVKREPGFADRQRPPAPGLQVEQRIAADNPFAEIRGCLGDEAARAEAARCLLCDLERRLAVE